MGKVLHNRIIRISCSQERLWCLHGCGSDVCHLSHLWPLPAGWWHVAACAEPRCGEHHHGGTNHLPPRVFYAWWLLPIVLQPWWNHGGQRASECHPAGDAARLRSDLGMCGQRLPQRRALGLLLLLPHGNRQRLPCGFSQWHGRQKRPHQRWRGTSSINQHASTRKSCNLYENGGTFPIHLASKAARMGDFPSALPGFGGGRPGFAVEAAASSKSVWTSRWGSDTYQLGTFVPGEQRNCSDVPLKRMAIPMGI